MTKKKTLPLVPIDLDNYQITGFYYTEKDKIFRKYLNIKSNSFKGNTPDLMVIMMNPGSSKPIIEDDNLRIETEAYPDLTQHQIMRIMEAVGFQYARILNLSDLRQAKSSLFYKEINRMEENGIIHSIFHPERKAEFDELFISGVPVIFAWGVNKRLIALAKAAMAATQKEQCFGIQKQDYNFSFYHPLPRTIQKQRDWYETISEQLTKPVK